MSFDSNDIERSEIVKKVIEIYAYKPYSIVAPSLNNNTIVTNITSVTNNNNANTTNNTTNNITTSKATYELYYKIYKNKKTNIKENDAAVIPKHHAPKTPHITHNYDIFFESRDF